MTKKKLERLHTPFKTATLRGLEKQVALAEISYGKMVEILNTKSHEYADQQTAELKAKLSKAEADKQELLQLAINIRDYPVNNVYTSKLFEQAINLINKHNVR
jgi:hypothetical protein